MMDCGQFFKELRIIRKLVSTSFDPRMQAYQTRTDGQMCTVYSSLAKLQPWIPVLSKAARLALAKLAELEEKHRPQLSPHMEVAARLFPWTATQPLNHMTRDAVHIADAEILRLMTIVDNAASGQFAHHPTGYADPEELMRGPASSRSMRAIATPSAVEWSVAEEFANWKEGPLQVPNWAHIYERDFPRYLQAAAQKWPRLHKVMLRVFATPASSAWLESSFSIATWLADPRRSRLTPDHMADLTLLTCNKEMAQRHIRSLAAG
jgi:hypothetical protein